MLDLAPATNPRGDPMIRLAALILMLATSSARADGAVTVPLPDIPRLQVLEYEQLLREIVILNVAGHNCPGFLVNDAEFALLIGSADIIAERIDLDDDNYERRFDRPAFALLDKPETCALYGPQIQPMIQRLVGWGGGLTPIP